MSDCRKVIVRETRLIPRTDIEVERRVVREEGNCGVDLSILWRRFDALLQGVSKLPAAKILDDAEYRVGRGTHRW